MITTPSAIPHRWIRLPARKCDKTGTSIAFCGLAEPRRAFRPSGYRSAARKARQLLSIKTASGGPRAHGAWPPQPAIEPLRDAEEADAECATGAKVDALAQRIAPREKAGQRLCEALDHRNLEAEAPVDHLRRQRLGLAQ